MTAPVTQVRGRAFLMERDDVDTDAIYPAEHLKTIEREGLGGFLFADWVAAGHAAAAFVTAPWPTPVLVAGRNFGCGSSREHAVWALAEHGVQAVLALSFGDIFRHNCVNNGLIAATLAPGDLEALVRAFAQTSDLTVTIDVEAGRVRLADGAVYRVEFAPGHASKLLSGEDDITRTLRLQGALSAYEFRVAAEQPWLA